MKQSRIPLYVYAVTLSSLCVIIGLRWDISWHGTVGRDTFLTPPHVMVYLAAITGGTFSGMLLIKYSFVTKEDRESLVKIWGIFYSPLGPLFCIWGALAMLASAPFDNWWHNAYGLDVVIASPPHTLLGLGMLSMQLGACMSISKFLGRRPLPSNERHQLRILYTVASASLLSMMTLWVSDYIDKRSQHGGLFYLIIAVDILLFLPAFGLVLQMRYGMTIIAFSYFLLTAAINWILQSIPAYPKLAPVLNPLTHLVALPFPLLLFIPAYAMDFIMAKQKNSNVKKALSISAVFIALLLAVQYPFSTFLLTSTGARNWFFGSDAWPYNLPPDWPYRYRYQPSEESDATALFIGLFIAVLIGFFTAWLSLCWGRWMLKIQR